MDYHLEMRPLAWENFAFAWFISNFAFILQLMELMKWNFLI